MLPVAIEQPYPEAFYLQPLPTNPKVLKQVTQDHTPYLLGFSKIPSPVPCQNTPWVRPSLSAKSAIPVFKQVLLLVVYSGSLWVGNYVAQMEYRLFRSMSRWVHSENGTHSVFFPDKSMYPQVAHDQGPMQ